MIQFKLNDKKIQVATSWDDLSYEQFHSFMVAPSDTIRRISICSGVEEDLLRKSRIEGAEAVITAVNFVATPAKWDTPVLQCGKYKLPVNHKGQYNIQFENLGQFEDLRKIIEGIKGDTQVERATNIAECYPSMVAIYLQKIRDGEYDYNKAVEMIPEVKTMPAREVVTLGSFFLVKLLSLSTGTQVSSPSTPPNLKKSKRVSKGSNKSSARSPRSRK